MTTIKAYIRLLRPHQWTKNLLIFVGVIFSGRLLIVSDILDAMLAFGVFCLLSSAVYTLNDIVDVKRDRLHPTKRNRPLAAEKIPVWLAWVSFVLMSLVALGLSVFFLGFKFWAMAVFYFLLNVAYSLFVKRVIILDVMFIAAGYVIRAVAGVFAIVAISTGEISLWLLICTFFLALFLALAKRRGEITDLKDAATKTRDTLIRYSPKLLDEMIAVVTASTVLSYSLYTIWPETIERLDTRRMAFTIPIVIFGIFRYLYLIHRKGKGASPSKLIFSDIPLIASIAVYGITVYVVLYIMV
ncbi:MAG: decaprenyl-phosphate phosphoribosyltransferase [bacterium]|nr:decaprenyl-phosphate phosphoribosyltransferase [bacterium]